MPRTESPTRPIAVKASTAATMLDCSRQFVYQLIERGTLRRINIPGTVAIRIPIEDVYAVLGQEVTHDGAA